MGSIEAMIEQLPESLQQTKISMEQVENILQEHVDEYEPVVSDLPEQSKNSEPSIVSPLSKTSLHKLCPKNSSDSDSSSVYKSLKGSVDNSTSSISNPSSGTHSEIDNPTNSDSKKTKIENNNGALSRNHKVHLPDFSDRSTRIPDVNNVKSKNKESISKNVEMADNGSSNSNKNEPHIENKGKNPLKSLMDFSFNFTESPENNLKAVAQHQEYFFQSLDNLPTDLQYATLKEFEQSLGISSEDALSSSNTNIACGGTTIRCGSKFYNHWPIPTTIEEVHQMRSKESLEGTPQSQLALCLHLMESAYLADPDNNTILTQDGSKQGSGVFNDIVSTFRRAETTPTTLADALVFESKKLLKQLAKEGQYAGVGADAESQFILGSCYGMGALGWPINPKRAFQWYLQASKYDHPEAAYRTGVCYEMGIGTERNGLVAVQFFKKASVLMHVPAMYKLGIISMHGYCGVPINKREAVIWLQRAACISIAPIAPGKNSDPTTTGGYGGVALPHALYALAILHMKNECEDTSLISDPKYALRLFHDSARFGYAPSQVKLGEIYECGKLCHPDELKSIYWYTLAAKQDFPEGCLGLSNWFLTGSTESKSLPQSDKQAFLWAQKAVRLSKSIHNSTLTANASYVLGAYYESGIGTPKSTEIAKKYYQKAAQHGHTEAMKMIID